METPVIQENINRLKAEVAEYSNSGKSYFSTNIIVEKVVNFPFKSYIIVPIVVLLFLCYIRPDFVKYDDVNEDGESIRRVGYKKVLIYWLVISTILVVGIFGYNYKVGNLEA